MRDISEEWLRKEYIENQKIIPIIAQEIGVSPGVISRRLKKFNISRNKGGRKRHPINIGQVFDRLTVLSSEMNKFNRIVYKCKCSCGEIIIRSGNQLLHAKRNYCLECIYKDYSKKRRKGFEEISGHFWYNILACAKNRNKIFEITIEDAWNQFLKQNRKCAITGVELFFHKPREIISVTTASLDRIDSTKGYTKDNIQWVHKVINIMKFDLKEEEFINWCKLVVEKQK